MTRDRQQANASPGANRRRQRRRRSLAGYRPGLIAGALVPAAAIVGVPAVALVYHMIGSTYAFSLVLSVVFMYVLARPTDGFWIPVLLVALAQLLFRYTHQEVIAQWSALGVVGAARQVGLGAVVPGVAMLAGHALARRRKGEGQARAVNRPLLGATLGVAVVCLVSVGYGLHRGNAVPFVIRQASGPALLFLYMAAAALLLRAQADWARAVRAAERVVACYAAAYLARYGASSLASGEFRFNEDAILCLASMFAASSFAVLLFSKVPQERRRAWLLLPLFAIGSVMSGSRGDVAAAIAACGVVILLKVARSPAKFAAATVPLLLILALAPLQAARKVLSETSIGASLAQRFLIPPRDDVSYNLRAAEMRAVSRQAQTHPLLGAGMGSTFNYFNPYSGRYMQGTYVDGGLGYLLLRFGYLGAATAIAWVLFMLGSVLRRCLVKPSAENAALAAMFAYYTASLVFIPSFFQFLTSWWGGALCGYVLCSTQTRPTPPRPRLAYGPALRQSQAP